MPSAVFRLYQTPVSSLRAFVLLLFGLALFVQVSAQAAAVPLGSDSSDCAEMVRTAHDEESAGRSSHDEGSCKEMALDCLIAMNCIAPIALPGAALASDLLQPHGIAYAPGISDRLEGRQMRPESPPPQ